MSGADEDDKPTVVLDLNALKKQKQKQEEEMNNIVNELEFNVGEEGSPSTEDSEDFAENFLNARKDVETKQAPASSATATGSITKLRIILFDLQSDFFKKALPQLPKGMDYKLITNLNELNQQLRVKEFQIAVFNYDGNPKAVNQLTAQIKQKFTHIKTVIMAKNISPEKAKIHAKTPSGANGYYQLPLDAAKVMKEFVRIHEEAKKKGA
jgi:hypothetical protein